MFMICKYFFKLIFYLSLRFALLPPQGFGPEAKTRGGIIAVPAYLGRCWISEIWYIFWFGSAENISIWRN